MSMTTAGLPWLVAGQGFHQIFAWQNSGVRRLSVRRVETNELRTAAIRCQRNVISEIPHEGEDFVARMMERVLSIPSMEIHDSQYWCRVSLGTML